MDRVEYICSDCNESKQGLVSHDVCPSCSEAHGNEFEVKAQMRLTAEQRAKRRRTAEQQAKRRQAEKAWEWMRDEALQRAEFECEECGITQSEHRADESLLPPDSGLHVHHITKEASFDDPRCAHSLDNLRVLCYGCHMEAHEELNWSG